MIKERGLYAITDCEHLTKIELLEKTELILQSGAAVLQYRDKVNDHDSQYKRAKELNQLCRSYNSLFIVNDDIKLAKRLEADGVHIGKNDNQLIEARELLGNKIIGVSCYNDLERARNAEKQGADYVAFGSFFPSIVKPDAVKADFELLMKANQQLSLPIVAIGGITPDNGRQLIEAGADYLAVISALYQSNDTQQTTLDFINLFN